MPSRFGFPSAQRLHSSKEFGRVFAEPIRSVDRFFTVLARPNGLNVPRLGLTVSRRAAKRAVDRNRLKRLARESFRLQRRLPSCDFVVVAKPGAGEAPGPELRRSLDRHFDRLRRKAGQPDG
ncbi:MAG TPA: ribonuclease P protein component [Gammaproteobacteria bacterium]